MSLCSSTAPSGSCTSLQLVANDGTYLGDATSNTFAANGVCNDVSSYGSSYGSYSIFNSVGNYGSSYSSASAYNQITSTPPHLACADTGKLLNPVSKNQVLVDAIDPDVLCKTLQADGY